MRKLSISKLCSLTNKGFDKIEAMAQARKAESDRKKQLRTAEAALALKQARTLARRSKSDIEAIIAGLQK